MSVFTSGLTGPGSYIGTGYDPPKIGLANTTDESQTDVFGALWGNDINNGRKFISGPEVTTASTIWPGSNSAYVDPYIKVYYPDVSEGLQRGDILFLVARGWTAGGGWIEPEVLGGGWQELRQPYLGNDGYLAQLRAERTRQGIPGNKESAFLGVWYKVIETSSYSSNSYEQIFFSWANGNRPASGWYEWYGRIFGYRKSNTLGNRVGFSETQFGHNFYDSGLSEHWDLNTAPFTSAIHTVEDPDFMNGNGDYTKNGEVGGNRIYIDDNLNEFWNENGIPPEAAKIKKYNKLAVSIMATAFAGISPAGGQYTPSTALSSTNPNGWVKRAGGFSSPSLIVGDACITPNDPNLDSYEQHGGMGADTYVNGPIRAASLNGIAEMEVGFTLQGYTNHKRWSGSGFSALSGIIKFSIDSLAFPDSTSITVYKNDNPVIYWTLEEGEVALDEKGPLTARVEGAFGDTYTLFKPEAFIWDDPSQTAAGLSVNVGDYIYIDAISAKNDDESYFNLTIEGFPMQYETIMSTDLRDSGGHRMDIIRMQDFGSEYPIGGLTLTPADFGMNEIKYMQIQPGTAYAEMADDVAVLASQQTASAYVDAVTGETYWKINVFVPDPETGLPVELAAGSPLQFPEGLTPTIMVLGA